MLVEHIAQCQIYTAFSERIMFNLLMVQFNFSLIERPGNRHVNESIYARSGINRSGFKPTPIDPTIDSKTDATGIYPPFRFLRNDKKEYRSAKVLKCSRKMETFFCREIIPGNRTTFYFVEKIPLHYKNGI